MITIVLINVAVWASWGLLVSFVGTRLPAALFASNTAVRLFRTLHRERSYYRQLGIRRWKDRLPEAGGLFGGRSKRHLGGHGREALQVFAAETRRGELVHWADLAIWPVFAIWNPVALTLVMLVYGVAANLPCIAVQRYNRLRIDAALAKWGPAL